MQHAPINDPAWTAGSAKRRQAGPSRPGQGGGAALSRALPGLHGQALSRASGEGSRLRLGLRLVEVASAVEGRCRKGAAQRRAPEEARAAAPAGDDAASGRFAPRLAGRPAPARPHPRIKSGSRPGTTMDDGTGRSTRRSSPRRKARLPSWRSRRFSRSRACQ